ncbi:MAG: WecB/TagA/CpsF family glycosyltransferase [bacterium]
MFETITILNTKLTLAKPEAISQQASLWLRGKKQRQIVTPNPEFLLIGLRDEKFHYILNQADLAVPDGIGLKFAAWLQGKNLYRLAGSDLVQTLLSSAQSAQLPVAIINRRDGLSDRQAIEQAVHQRWPRLSLLIQDIGKDKLNYDLATLRKFQPILLLCSLGAPVQDKLIHKLLPELPSVKVGMGVGGSFDFLTGRTKRSPRWLRNLGLEWLWRLFIQPQNKMTRLARIYRAVVCFSWLAFREQCLNRFFYRPNVVGWLFNREGEVLILNSNKVEAREDYWGLPQGGIDAGENGRQALWREMKEEIGTNNFKILAEYQNIFKYRWPKNYGIMGYKGQKQSLYILEWLGNKSEIKLSNEHKAQKWVAIDKLLSAVDPIHQTAYKLFMAKYQETIKKS